MSHSSKNQESLMEKTLHSVEAYIGKFLRVQRDQVELPDGSLGYREYIRHPGAAMIAPLLSNGDLLLVRQYRHASKKIFWEFPAGKIDKGEAHLQTAHRELKEETGFTANKMTWLTEIFPVIGYADEVIHLYLAEDLVEGKQQLDHGEHLELHRKSLPELLQMVRRHEITDVKTQIAIFWLDQIQRGNWATES